MRGVIQLFTENLKIAGEGLQFLLILNSGNVKCAFFILVSDVLVVNGVDCLRLQILVHEVDPWQVGPSLGVSARFVLFESFPTFFLSMSLELAKVAEFAVSVCVVSTTRASSSFGYRS